MKSPQQLKALLIEKLAFVEVIHQFTKGCDSRMETGLNAFLCSIEKKIAEIEKELSEK